MDDPLKGYFNHQGVRHIGFKNHRKYRRSYHGCLNHRHHHYNVRQLNSNPDPLPSTPRTPPPNLQPTPPFRRQQNRLHGNAPLTPPAISIPSRVSPPCPRQLRTKVHKPTASESTVYIKAGVFTDMTLKPYAVALIISRTYTVGSGSYIQRWQCYTGKG
ncbi:hypothetical protein D6D12_04009 [Aureobasidium pullulans]|uniref:Uncharacterized protein n=1 Tax=Aureobasidium pullulans TaxID=5580 RepID=A0AB74JYB9_AURPU|nr:hypothetical protein D6D12_04009 [Aureobasidium pullulans]THX35837.1 hypothetical protein D6D11_09546 [Aureobasidium pullulans]